MQKLNWVLNKHKCYQYCHHCDYTNYFPECRPLRASSLTVCSEWLHAEEQFHYRNPLQIVKNYCCASQKEREKNILSSSHGTNACSLRKATINIKQNLMDTGRGCI